jgi:hypothetical protein
VGPVVFAAELPRDGPRRATLQRGCVRTFDNEVERLAERVHVREGVAGLDAVENDAQVQSIEVHVGLCHNR